MIRPVQVLLTKTRTRPTGVLARGWAGAVSSQAGMMTSSELAISTHMFKLLGGNLFEDHSNGLEAFYNLAITPAAALTFDVQVSEDPFPGTDITVLFGARLQMRF